MPADPRRVKELFAAAAAVADPTARDALLARECGSDSELRKRLEVFLRAHDRPESALERPLALPDPDATIDRRRPAAVGDVVGGRFKLLERIGEGGMGEVWVADQFDPARRRVALKVIKPGMDSRSVLARFEAERQALALMDHPNVAKVFDAGTAADGRPFFVMELVKGTPITEFCDTRKLSPRDRLQLFVPVCQAIQHAHQKGIIHRDVMPGNVLVALHDEAPIPKVIDFGVAKAVGQSLTDKTVYTGFGVLIGTPAYMSPEQATFNQLDVDTRADVYSLGVLLYELLAGTPPFDPAAMRKAALDEILRIVREEEPPRPSTRLGTSEAKATIAATRGADPVSLSRLMRGELDWIVMKSLEKDRTRRYDSAAGLARDVERYLNDETVEACPPTVGYRVRKAYRKYRLALWVVAAFVLIETTPWPDGFARPTVFAAGGRAFAIAGRSAVGVFDAATGKPRVTLAAVPELDRVALSPDGSRLVMVRRGGFGWSGDGTAPEPVPVWDTAAGTPACFLKGLASSIRDAVFAPDGQRIVTSSHPSSTLSGEFRVWDAVPGGELLRLPYQPGFASPARLAFSPDGHRLVMRSLTPAPGRDDDQVWDATPRAEGTHP